MSAYTLTLTEAEHETLAWVADRYQSAQGLWDGSDEEWSEDGTTVTLTIPEPVAWDYLGDLPDDNGVADAVLPPCVGGTLAEKLLAFYESIV